MEFNNSPSKILLIDINSCFATIEQQANPFLRGKPVVVAAYDTPKGAILASSTEAKRLGIKTGMKVVDGLNIYSNLKVLLPDPPKYRFVHNKLHKLLLEYSPKVEPKSIDEFIVEPINKNLLNVAREIKARIKKEVGEYITVSIGIAPNRYLAKVAAGIIKPDGLVEINKDSYLEIYSKLKLTDLTGVKTGISSRLNMVGIYSVLDFYSASCEKLKIGLKKVAAHSWYMRLRGYEIDSVPTKRKSFGNEVSLKITNKTNIDAIIARLFDKANFRARNHGFRAKKKEVFISNHKISVRLSNLASGSNLQFDLFGKEIKKDKLEKASDEINKKWGSFVVGSARGFTAQNIIKDRISFQNLS